MGHAWRNALWGLAALNPAAAVMAQEQQQAATIPQAAGPPVYDIVAADRETAWRINRMTGEVTVCRVDTTATLDGVRARCTVATHDQVPQQARTPPDGGINRP